MTSSNILPRLGLTCLALPLLLLGSANALLAQHPAPIPISDIAANSLERTAIDARLSPDGMFVAYSARNGSNGTTHSLFLRRADGSSPTATQVTTVSTTTTAPFFPNIGFAWRHSTPLGTSKLLFGRRTLVGGYDLVEFDPATSATTVRGTFAPPPVGSTRFLSLQLHPCRNVVSGVQITFQGQTSSLDQVWFVNLNGGTPTFPPGATATGQLTALDMAPNDTVGLFMEHPTNGNRVWQYTVAAPHTTTQVLNATASSRTGGYLNNSQAYGIDSATHNLAAWSTPNVPITLHTSVVTEAAASPDNLLGAPAKQFFAFVDSLNQIRLTPTTYGGEILLTSPPAGFTSCVNVSLDGMASQVAFIAVGGNRQVFVLPMHREMRNTFSHPNGSNTVTFDINASCATNEFCVVAVALGLTNTPMMFGSPGSGQNDLDGSVATLGFSYGAPFHFQSMLAFNPAFIGLTLFYQAGRADLNSLAPVDTTRASAVKYY